MSANQRRGRRVDARNTALGTGPREVRALTTERMGGADVTALQATAGSMEGVGPATAQRFTAMVVDDHPLLRESIVTRLRSMGAREVVEAASVAEARARAHAVRPP